MRGAAVYGVGFVKDFLLGFFYEPVTDVHISSFFRYVKPGVLHNLYKRDNWCSLTKCTEKSVE